MPRHIAFLVFPRFQLLDATGPIAAFEVAGRICPGSYQLRVIAERPGLVASSSGVTLAAARLGSPAAIDTLVVAGGDGTRDALGSARLRRFVEACNGQSRRVTSVCSGSFLLAGAGLLDGRSATTHWSCTEEFRGLFPRVRLDPDRIYVREGRVWTSAGITAGIDLALALVEDDLGGAIALEIARQLVVFLKRPGGQAQFSAMLSLQSADESFGPLHEWIGQNLDAELSVPDLAARAKMSERTFLRRYKQATGATPAKTIERLRVEAAQRRLCDSSDRIKRNALHCGFGSEETMRRSFLRLLDTTPQDYRARFAS